MIEDNNQYLTIKKKLAEFESTLAKTIMSSKKDCTNKEKLDRSIVINSLQSFISKYKEDINQYEKRITR